MRKFWVIFDKSARRRPDRSGKQAVAVAPAEAQLGPVLEHDLEFPVVRGLDLPSPGRC